MKTIDISYLEECISFDSKTGDLTWKTRPRDHFKTNRSHSIHKSRDAGKPAGSIDKSQTYLVVGITFQGRFQLYQGHRIAWALHYKQWPIQSIDHIDGDKTNNRIENLRECSHVQNMANQLGRSKKIGTLKGAYFHKRIGKWQATICIAYQQTHLGYFLTEEEAHFAYTKAAKELQGEFMRKI